VISERRSGSPAFVLIQSVLWPVVMNSHPGFLGVSQTLGYRSRRGERRLPADRAKGHTETGAPELSPCLSFLQVIAP
jgi:hypothetical protein